MMTPFFTRRMPRYKTLIGLVGMLIVTWLMLSSVIIMNQHGTKDALQSRIEQVVQRHVQEKYAAREPIQLKPDAQQIRLKLLEQTENDSFRLIFYDDGKAELSLPRHVFEQLKRVNLTLEYSVQNRRPELDIDMSIHEFASWNLQNRTFCKYKFTTFANEFAFLSNVIVDPTKAIGRRGGEELQSVINQPEKNEYFSFKPGFFNLPCEFNPSYKFASQNHLNQWTPAIANDKYYEKLKGARTDAKFTLAVTRYEFANLYHTMTDYYNAFLMMKFFKRKPEETSILFVDGHPKSSLDAVWVTLFGDVRRLGHIANATRFNELVWAAQGYNSPMNKHKLHRIPLVEEFREFFLTRHAIPVKTRPLNCSDIRLLFIFRHDYVAHPRNPSGKVSRKIKNEKELVDAITHRYRNIRVKAVQIDKFDMASQLKMVADTDILVGMHGAGLSHTLFLPGHAGLIEFYPAYWASSNIHFRAMAHWRGIRYEHWVNRDRHNESPNHYTHIPPAVLMSTLRNLLAEMKCTSMR